MKNKLDYLKLSSRGRTAAVAISLIFEIALSSAFGGLLALTVVSSLPSELFASYSQTHTPEDSILAKGFAAYMDGKDKSALSYFEEVLRINPYNRAARTAVKKVKVRLNKEKDKDAQRNKVLAKAKIHEGKQFLKSNDVVGAIDAFHVALDADPKNRTAKKELNVIRKKMTDLANRKKMNLSSWALARGSMAYLDRDWTKAYRIWSERLNLEPQNVVLANAKARAEYNFINMMMSEKEEFLRRGAREFYRQGLYLEAKGSWQRLLKLKEDDQEGLEGFARAENAILRLHGKNQDKKEHDLLERGLELYAGQNWLQAREVFKELAQLNPEFQAAREYLLKINNRLQEEQYVPSGAGVAKMWREERPSNIGKSVIQIPENLENLEERRLELESQMKRDPSNIRIQQELDKMKRMQDEESERMYKDGLIAYSQGNRSMAIGKWKQVLVLNPDHKKASAALKKAQAEEERAAEETTSQ